jgi:hypothetical protein
VSRVIASASLLCLSLLALSCTSKSLDPISAETLIGRWRAVTKVDAEDGGPHRDARTPTGDTVAFRYEFKPDHSCEFSSEIKGGLISKVPQFVGKHATRGTWNVVEVGRDTLIVEFHNAGGLAPRVKLVFQTKDRCVFNPDDPEEALVLTRLP